MFGSLQESQMRYHDPSQFCKKLQWDGVPVDTSRQQDASEFLTKLFQIIDNSVSGTTHRKMLADILDIEQVSVLDGGERQPN